MTPRAAASGRTRPRPSERICRRAMTSLSRCGARGEGRTLSLWDGGSSIDYGWRPARMWRLSARRCEARRSAGCRCLCTYPSQWSRTARPCGGLRAARSGETGLETAALCRVRVERGGARFHTAALPNRLQMISQKRIYRLPAHGSRHYFVGDGFAGDLRLGRIHRLSRHGAG